MKPRAGYLGLNAGRAVSQSTNSGRKEETNVTDQIDAVEIPAAPSGGSNRRVLLGCGIGCGLLVFLVVIGTILFVIMGNKALNKMDALSKPYLEEEYPLWKEGGIITAENEEVYEGLYGAVFDEELGSRWVTICALIMVVYHTEDGTITAAEIEQAQGLLDDINEQPGLGFTYWGEFIQSDEGLQEASQKVPLLVQGTG